MDERDILQPVRRLGRARLASCPCAVHDTHETTEHFGLYKVASQCGSGVVETRSWRHAEPAPHRQGDVHTFQSRAFPQGLGSTAFTMLSVYMTEWQFGAPATARATPRASRAPSLWLPVGSRITGGASRLVSVGGQPVWPPCLRRSLDTPPLAA
ncbi:hypothetical protein E2C01_016522 [Portunus trituberculatus]|uniref:Uncharacterized protein n=1 Tax=Portunus trituberculatus TaxID=210409 RepID=A0A5B7DPB8_PORTR|nr:hypothetical protein [Portunus trituberculatus]